MNHIGDYERQVMAELDAEYRLASPVHQAFEYKAFVSRSAGKGRKRKQPIEVEFIVNRRSGKATTWENFSFDLASEHFDGDYVDMTESEFIKTLVEKMQSANE